MKILKSKKTMIVLLVAVAALLWAIQLYKDDVEQSLHEAVESRGSRILGTRVDVGDVTVDWDAGRVSFTELRIANPGGFSNRNMITADAVVMRGDLDDRLIERVVLSGVETLVEFRGARSNFETLGDRVASRAADDDTADAGQDANEEEAEVSEEAENGKNGENGEEPVRDDWRIENVEFESVRVRVEADWTSDVIDFDAGALSIDALDAGADDLARAVTVRFLDRVLVSAAGQVDDERLREGLMEKAEELRDRLGAPEQPASD